MEKNTTFIVSEGRVVDRDEVVLVGPYNIPRSEMWEGIVEGVNPSESWEILVRTPENVVIPIHRFYIHKIG